MDFNPCAEQKWSLLVFFHDKSLLYLLAIQNLRMNYFGENMTGLLKNLLLTSCFFSRFLNPVLMFNSSSRKILCTNNFLFSNTTGMLWKSLVFSFMGCALYYFHYEGDTCIHVHNFFIMIYPNSLGNLTIHRLAKN